MEPLKALRTLGKVERVRLVLVDDRCADLRTWAGVARQLVDGTLDSFRKDDVRWAIDAVVGLGRVAAPSPPPGAAAVPGGGPKTQAFPAYGPRTPSIPSFGPKTQSFPGSGPFAPRVPAPAPPPVPEGAPPGARTILIVEDTVSLRALLGIRLEAAGWSVRWADTAEEALQKVEAEGCDAVLADVNLPGMSGDQLVLTIRKQYPGVALLLMTGLPQERRPKVPAGIPMFGKPLDMDAVIRVLEKAVKPRPTGGR